MNYWIYLSYLQFLNIFMEFYNNNRKVIFFYNLHCCLFNNKTISFFFMINIFVNDCKKKHASPYN